MKIRSGQALVEFVFGLILVTTLIAVIVWGNIRLIIQINNQKNELTDWVCHQVHLSRVSDCEKLMREFLNES